MSNIGFSAGESYKKFRVTKSVPVEELGLSLVELEHEDCGARVMYIHNPEDSENLFSLSFKTLPDSSDGVAHILEHTVLCGSKKYPVKDPFFSMTRRSMNTFMNAMTGSDFTCYPASSEIEKDFYQLLDVYMDAVFFPNLEENSFLQEGHRLSFINPDDSTSKLEYKGVVFNEMKGALSDATSRLWHKMEEHLMPNLPYHHNSGGDPKEIPNLTHEKLIEFHKTYYAPSRCIFFFYGNLSLEKHLDFIEEHALKNAEKLDPIPEIPLQKRFSAPVKIEDHYPIHDQEDLSEQAIHSFGYLTCQIKNQEEVLALSLLDSIFFETDASPIKLALLQSGFCKEAAAYIDPESSEIPYMIICRGCKHDTREKIGEVLQDAFSKLADAGIAKETYESALHQMEFSRLEITGDRQPYGLTLFFRSALMKQHGCDAENALLIRSLFNRLRKKLEDKNYLPNLIRKYFIENKHQVHLAFLPDPELDAKEKKAEEAKLETVNQSLSDQGKQAIVEQSKQLEKYHAETETQDLSCLPDLKIQEIPKACKRFPLDNSECKSGNLLFHQVNTNGILYTNLGIDIVDLSDEEKEWVPLFLSLFTQLGVGKRSYIENLEYIQSCLGSINAHISLYQETENPNVCTPNFQISASAFTRNHEQLTELMHDTLYQLRFDEKERVREWCTQIFSSRMHGLNRNALGYALRKAASGFTASGSIKELWYGIPSLRRLKKLVENFDTMWPELQKRLIGIQQKLVGVAKKELIVTSDKESFDLFKKNLCQTFKVENNDSSDQKLEVKLEIPQSQSFEISASVAFNSCALKTVNYDHVDSPALLVATEILRNRTLHPEIREKGNAYGSGASYNSETGTFAFRTYRDPHIQRSYNVFKESTELLAAGKFDQSDIDEGILGIIQETDNPVSPGSRGIVGYGLLKMHKTDEKRQKYRETILNLDKKAIEKAVKTHLVDNWDQTVNITFAGKELIKKEGQSLPVLEQILSS